MTTFNDIANGRLIYTCRCGWVDKGHANPKSAHPDEGAKNLLDNVLYERGTRSLGYRGPGFIVRYQQSMRKYRISDMRSRVYWVRSGLSYRDKLSVALSIFMRVSYDFEDLQSNWPYGYVTDSGYSEEDLVSNLIGFYSAASPLMDYVELCDPVSVKASETVWKNCGPVGSHKNRTFSPNLHPCNECKNKLTTFPLELTTIQPRREGVDFYRLKEENLWRRDHLRIR